MSRYGEQNRKTVLEWFEDFHVVDVKLKYGAWHIIFEDGRAIEFDGTADGICYMDLEEKDDDAPGN